MLFHMLHISYHFRSSSYFCHEFYLLRVWTAHDVQPYALSFTFLVSGKIISITHISKYKRKAMNSFNNHRKRPFHNTKTIIVKNKNLYLFVKIRNLTFLVDNQLYKTNIKGTKITVIDFSGSTGRNKPVASEESSFLM